MLPRFLLQIALMLAAAAAKAADAPPARSDETIAEPVARTAAVKDRSAKKADGDAKTLSGMSILGNQEAPKALVIVPWKSSTLGEQVGLSKALDDGRRPVDKDVFMRELSYYEIRSGSK